MDITALYQLFLGCTGVTTDSRNCPKGSLFIALKATTSMVTPLQPKRWKPEAPTQL